MKKKLFGAIALLALIAAPALAEAATRGFATANVNMRSGPSTAYPAVVVIPNGAPLTIHGCLSDTPWCDVSFSYGRGWVAGRYVQAMYRQNRVYVEPRYYRDLGVPIVTFEVGRYWDQNYRDRDFYRERDRWRRPPPSGGYWNAPPPRANWDRPRPPREEWRDPRGRGPNDGRWEERYGNWDRNDRDRRDGNWDRNDRDRRDNDRRANDRDRWEQDRNRDQDRAGRDQRRDDDRRQWDGERRDRDRNRDGEGRPQRPQRDGQQFGCIVGSPGCPNP